MRMKIKNHGYTGLIGHQISRKGPVLVVKIDRPEVANSLNIAACESMAETFDKFDADHTAIAAIITGAGSKHFCAGMDLGCITPGKRVILPQSGFGGLTLRQTNKPLIAAINGLALGGGFEIALACDLIVADDSACFGLPEIHVGQAALAGGLLRLPHAIGQKRAMELILTGRMINTAEAAGWGLVNKTSADGTALDVAMGIAETICHGAPLALQASKAVATSRERCDNFCNAMHSPPSIVETMLDSDDALEGAAAFFEKRKPRWTGK